MEVSPFTGVMGAASDWVSSLGPLLPGLLACLVSAV